MEKPEDNVTPSDVLHFAEGMLYSLNKLVERCPNISFRVAMRSIAITDLARNIKYWKGKLEENKYIMSIQDYNILNKEIRTIYMETCIPCMRSPKFKKGDCHECEVMPKYIALQEMKRKLELL